MTATATILDILKYILPAIIVLIACSILMKRFLSSELHLKKIAMLTDNQEVTVRLRLQAYERLVIFIERIHPRQLVPRVYQTGMNVATLEALLVHTIKTEFEHNMSQQLFVSQQVWKAVLHVKEQEIHMINQVAQQLKPEDPATELHRRMVDYIMTMEGEVPSDMALELINQEAKSVLSYGAQAPV